MSKKNDFDWNYYLVAFIDLLGQQEIMDNFPKMPNPDNGEEIEEFKRAAINLLQTVKGFHDGFIQFFERHNRHSKKSPLGVVFGSTEIKFQRFSDGLVVFLSLRTKDINALPLEGIFPILIACGSMFIVNLSKGQPIRGGLEVGVGVELNENEIYGPVVSKAYNLESNIAAYPRIVLGEELVHYLKAHALSDSDENIPHEKLNVELAKICMSLVAIDDDGHPFIDYLSESFKEYLLPEYDEFIRKSYNYVVEQSDKWKNERNSKLAFRYSLLRNYFEASPPIQE